MLSEEVNIDLVQVMSLKVPQYICAVRKSVELASIMLTTITFNYR